MKTRPALLCGSVLILCTVFLVSQSVAAQRGAQPTQRGVQPAQRSAHPAPNRPRANQGHIPKAPPARSNPNEQRQAEHLPTGHVNDMPHVNHDVWYGREQSNDARFHMDKPFEHGHFAHFGPKFRYSVTRVDADLHRFWFPGGSFFEVASWDWPLCSDWCWDCGNDFVIYEDTDHAGWYLLYNIHTGVYVHAQYMGR